MKFEDHFSQLAKTYSMYRPGYPDALFEYLAGCCKEHNLAWDCGTGNGQAAVALTKYFEQVIATDASKEQIGLASLHPDITYRVEEAENVSLPDSSTDLLTAAAAVHWFNFEKFYRKVKSVLKPEGIVAFWTYNQVRVSPDVDSLVKKYIYEILGNYWPERFEYVRTGYRTLPFPFEELNPPEFEMTAEWDLNQLAGFLNSWSATKIYLDKTGKHPLNNIWDDLLNSWGDEKTKYPVRFPLFLRVGKVHMSV